MITSPDFADDGFTTLPGVLSRADCDAIAEEIRQAMEGKASGSIGEGQGGAVGGRNLMDRWRGWTRLTDHSTVERFLDEHVGSNVGLVRILYFDKPPGRGWSLSIHRDQSIAVKRHVVPPAPFSNPTRKRGVPHVVADASLLRQMVTLRLHLDPMHSDNGPLVVIPASHSDDLDAGDSKTHRDLQVIETGMGDVFAMRPLLLHGSRNASPQSSDHRRVVHLEFAAGDSLPAPYQWHRFEPL